MGASLWNPGASASDSAILGFSVDSVAELRTLSSLTYNQVFVTGYYTKGDGGGGLYYLDAADTSSLDNGGSILVASDGARWKLYISNGQVSVKQFGARLTSTAAVATETAAIQACVDFCKGTGTIYGIGRYELIIPAPPAGEYIRTNQILIDRPIKIRGPGQSNCLWLNAAGATTAVLKIAIAYDTINYFTVLQTPARVEISGVRFSSVDGVAGSATAHGIQCVPASVNPIYAGLYLDQCTITGLSGNGIDGVAFDGYALVTNSAIIGNFQLGVNLSSCSDWRFNFCDIASNKTDNVQLSTGVGHVFYGTNFYTPTRYNANVFGLVQATFTNCYFDLAQEHGVYTQLRNGTASQKPQLWFNNCFFRWSSQKTNNTYSDLYLDSTTVDGEVYVNECHFASLTNPYSANAPQYKININGGTNPKVVVDQSTVFDDGNLFTTAVCNVPSLITGGIKGICLNLFTTATVAAGATTYLGASGQQATDIARYSAGGTARIIGFFISTTAFPGAAQSYTYTLYKNGVSTGVSGTISGAAQNTVFVAANVSLVANDTFSVQLVCSGAAAAAYHTGGIYVKD